jgi:hypothetical protein
MHIGDYNVWRTKGLPRKPYRALHISGSGQVRKHTAGDAAGVTQCRHCLLDCIATSGSNYDLATFSRQQLATGATYASATAGHKCNLPFQTKIHQ